MLAVVALSVTLGAACGRSGSTVAPTLPIKPPTILPVPPSSVANWRADATVLATSGSGGCGWGRTVGETRTAVDWRITIDGAAITADEDMRNWPTDDVAFSGTLNGQRFTATNPSDPNYLKYVCQFRGGTLEGIFNADFTSFDATETLVWGPPGAETTVQRHWVGSRL